MNATYRVTWSAAAVLTATLLLGGCGDDISRTFGFTRDAPDEFQVTTRAPLSMPPDYALRPPQPGASRPQEQSSRLQAEAALTPQMELGGPAGGGGVTAGQQALIAAAGPAAPAGIRADVDRESVLDRPSQTFTERLMFWRAAPQPGTVVDAQRENQRLRENAALGRSVEAGDTPIIQRTNNSGWLGNLF